MQDNNMNEHAVLFKNETQKYSATLFVNHIMAASKAVSHLFSCALINLHYLKFAVIRLFQTQNSPNVILTCSTTTLNQILFYGNDSIKLFPLPVQN